MSNNFYLFFCFCNSVLSAARSAASQVGLAPRRRLSTDPRSCDQCGRCFKYPSDLKKHLQIHTGKHTLTKRIAYHHYHCYCSKVLNFMFFFFVCL